MVQRPKAHVRRAILQAAAQEFAELGLERATLASIASRAGTSIGNLYKYFPSKDAVFAAAIPPELVRELRALLRRRIDALGIEHDVGLLDAAHPYRAAAEELLRFTLAHRAELLFLLSRADGTSYASFRDDLLRHLVRLALGYAARAYPRARMTAARRRALVRIYRAFVVSIASILAEEDTEKGLGEATRHLTTYHLAGLRAFFEAAKGDGRKS